MEVAMKVADVAAQIVLAAIAIQVVLRVISWVARRRARGVYAAYKTWLFVVFRSPIMMWRPILSLRLKIRFARNKIVEWERRYWLAELAGTSVSLAIYNYTHLNGSTYKASAWWSNAAEFAAFYIPLLGKIIPDYWRRLRGSSAWQRTFGAFAASVREVGIAEALDSLVFRPLFLEFLPMLIAGSIFWTSFKAKVAADIIYYIVAIVVYEVNKRRAARFRRESAMEPAPVAALAAGN